VSRVGKGEDRGRRVGGLKAREQGGNGLDEGKSVRDGKGLRGVREKWMGRGSEEEHSSTRPRDGVVWRGPECVEEAPACGDGKGGWRTRKQSRGAVGTAQEDGGRGNSLEERLGGARQGVPTECCASGRTM